MDEYSPRPTPMISNDHRAGFRNNSVELNAAPLPTVVSLFSGAGGLDLGFHEEGFDIGIAFDHSAAAIRTHKRNFPTCVGIEADLTKLRPGGVLNCVLSAIPRGAQIGIIGGPPCQGFSRANAHSTADDSRNKLTSLYLKIIKKLKSAYEVEFIVFENVLGMRDVKHAPKYKSLVRGLERLGLDVQEQELCALDFGVPQTRKRIVLASIVWSPVQTSLRPRRRKGLSNVRDAIGALPVPAFFSRDADPDAFPAHPNHWTMNPRSSRFREGLNGREVRSFKLLSWDRPSPTIAFGHREIHIHPSGTRRLSIFEAMLLQGFPDWFVLEGNLSEQVEQVSNAVPPPLARSIASAFRRALAKRAAK
jgi:DNA (cytosine-5)-methyltransferase 1